MCLSALKFYGWTLTQSQDTNKIHACRSLDPEPNIDFHGPLDARLEYVDALRIKRLTLLSSGARPPLAGRSGRVAAPGSSSGTLLWRLQRRLALAPPVLPALLASLQDRNIDTGVVLNLA